MPRLTIDIDQDTHKAIKTMAAVRGQSIRTFVLGKIFNQDEKTGATATLEAIEELRNGGGTHYDSVKAMLDDCWKNGA